jgi:putative membrane protein
MLANLIKLAVLTGAGVAAWKALSSRETRPFLEAALQGGVADAEAARSAQLRGASAELRRFAQQMEHDRSELNRRLAEAAGVEVPEVDAKQRAALHKLDMQQGAAYDRAWLAHAARSHARAIRLCQREVEQSGSGAAIASETLPSLREHARKLSELKSGRADAVFEREETPVAAG